MARKRKRRRPRASKLRVGAPPGVLEVDPAAAKATLRVFRYDRDRVEEKKLGVDELRQMVASTEPGVLWVDVVGPGDVPTLTVVGEIFGVHPLVLEDITQPDQRAKAESYDGFDFFVTRMGRRDAEGLDIEQMCIVVTPRAVLTFQERDGDVLDPVRNRIREGRGRIRTRPAGYLAYALLDAIVDAYFPLVENLSDELDLVEASLYEERHVPELSQDIHAIRRDLSRIRRAVLPLREALIALVREESDIFDADTRVYVRDCADHAMQLVEMIDAEREVCNGLMEVHLTSVNNRMYEVMKVLTIIATLFMPLGFIAGVYGMNFDASSPYNMPELRWRFGYPFAIGLMVATAVGLLVLFRRLGWLGGRLPR